MLSSPAVAATVIDFDDLPSTNMYLAGGNNVGSFYPGVTFGPNVTGLELTVSTAFPPHSGSIAVWDPTDLTITISFASPQFMVGTWYTSFDLINFTAYNSMKTPLSSVTASANTDGTVGTSDFISLTAPNISSITLEGSPGLYVLDDLTFSSDANPIPEPNSLVLMLSTILVLTRAMPSSASQSLKRVLHRLFNH